MATNSRFPKLFEPGVIGKIKTKNRFIKTANGTSFIERDGFVGDRAIAYYEALAKGGIGLLIVESCGVEFPLACQHLDAQFRLSDDKYIPSYAELAKAVHAQGCPIMLQFQHAGPWNPTGFIKDRDAKCASTLSKEELPGSDFVPSRAMTPDEVKEGIEMWVAAGVRAWKAGFDGVEVNGGTCHQINTFLSRIWNKREDEYGPQSYENRTRYFATIISETKKRTSPDFTVTCLLNIREYNHPRATTMEEGVQMAKRLAEAGADAIQCRAHIYGHREGLLQPDRLLYPEAPKWLYTDLSDLDWSRKGNGAITPLAAAVKKVVNVPVWCSGRLDYKLGELFLEQGKMDYVPMVRRLLADHEYPNKVANNQLKDIRPCCGCLHCMDVRNKNQCIECRVNVDLGKERQYVIKPAPKKKNVMVIGGGLSGMQAAVTAAQRGHTVTLYEKSFKLGGLVPIAALVKDLETDVLLELIGWFKYQLKKNNVTIKMRTTVTPEMVAQIKPDAVILALGGTVVFPQIPGMDRKNVMDLTKLDKLLLLMGPKLAGWGSKIMMPGVGKRVVVMGGEHHGCEIAEWLTKRNRQVTICHTGEEFAEGMTVDDKLRLFPWYEQKGVKLYGGVKYNEVTEKGLIITTKEGKKITIEADTVMPSLFLKQNLDMEAQLKGKVPEVYTVGSCVKPEPDLMVDATAAGAKAGFEV
ncbi:MAG: FAD-dependent oxidoreductase [Dehalococcoidales bacterium]|nr:FAD-dependent oxidoreductase [Dehalococcoidales bacterium]